MIEAMNEFRQNQALRKPAVSDDNYRLASDRYLSEAVGFDSMPYTVPFDPERFETWHFLTSTRKHENKPHNFTSLFSGCLKQAL